MSQDSLIPVNGISINYEDSGRGHPIIFIHGFPFDKSTWEPQANFLSSYYRVISYDTRGFGASTSDRHKPSMDLYADDLVKLMDALSIDKAVICGLSMGGYVVLNAVNRYAERFSGVVLCDTQCLSDSKEGMQNRFESIRDIEENGLEEFAEGFVKKVFCKKTQETNKELVDRTRKLILANSSESVTLALEALAKRRETCSILKKIKTPTLVLCGKEDSITPPPRSEFLFSTIVGARMHLIEHAGHLSNMEQPEVFNAQVYQFVSSLGI